MLKLGNTGINKLYLGSTEIKKAYLGSTLVFDNTTSYLYEDVSAMYTLRRPNMTNLWTNAVLRLRRSSDNQQIYVFFDSNGKISLSSFIGISTTTPLTTTLGTWIGSNDAFVTEWVALSSDNIIDTNKIAKQSTGVKQPQFISSGTIITKNGEPAIDFLSDTRYLQASANSDLDSGNDFSIFTVSNNVTASNNASILNTTALGTDFERFKIADDRSSGKLLSYIRGVGEAGLAITTLAQQDNSNQKLQTVIVTDTDIKGYYNSIIQGAGAYLGDYLNKVLRIGCQQDELTPLNGTIQEVIIFPSDKTSVLSDIDTDINNYYSIY